MKIRIVCLIMLIMITVSSAISAEVSERYSYDFLEDGYILITVDTHDGSVKYGILDMEGNTVADPVYNTFVDYSSGTAVFRNDVGDYIFVNTEGEVITTLNGRHAGQMGKFSEGLALIEYDGLWGYIDTEGHFVIEPQYTAIDDVHQSQKWYVDLYGFESLYEFTDDVALMTQDGRFGCIDKTGEFIVPPEFYDMYISGGLIVGKRNYKYEVFDQQGNQIVGHVWDTLSVSMDGNYIKVAVEDENGLDSEGLLDRKGNILAEAIWDDLSCNELEDGLYIVAENDGKIYVIAPDSSITEIEIDGYVKLFSNGIIYNGEHLISVTGNPVTEHEFIEVEFTGTGSMYDEFTYKPDGTGYFRCLADDGYMLVTPDGMLVTEEIFEEIGGCGNGLFNVCREGKWGYIDTAGNTVIDFNWCDAKIFRGGIAAVKNDIGSYIIDTSGNVVKNAFDPEDGIEWNGLEGTDARFIISIDGRMHVIDLQGNVILPKTE